jgi:hypothetical protein
LLVSEAVLERALRDLGREVEFPRAPDLAEEVGRRLRSEPEPAPRKSPPLVRGRLERRPLALGLAVLAAAVGAAFAVPQTRAAILDLLGVGGATIERVETLPPAEERGLAVPGAPVSLEQAEQAADFPLRVPEGYDAVYLDRSFRGGLVSFAWRDDRLVLTQFRGEATPYIEKSAGPGTRIRQVEVDESFGYWLTGRRHVVVFADDTGNVRDRRVAGNVLLWERDGVTYRLEGARTLAQALDVVGGLE